MTDRVEALARELWEAHSTHHEALTRMPAEPWDGLDDWMRNHWRLLARTAVAFLSGPGEPVAPWTRSDR